MSTGVIERYAVLEAEAEDPLAMHFAAMRVMDSTRGGGWGTFRVDGLTDEQADRLPDYLAQYSGRCLELVYFDDDEVLRECGGVLVDERHSKFTQWQTYRDSETGDVKRFFRWNRELWDYEAAEAIELKLAKEHRRRRQVKWSRRALMAFIVGVEYAGAFLMLKGAAEVASLEERNASQEQIQHAENIRDLGTGIAGASALAGVGYAVTQFGLVVSTELSDKKEMN